MNLIVNADKNWGIGKNNELLVHIPNDMKMFRQMTTGKVVVMGRKTLESFPNGMPLPKRTNIVLTHDKDISEEITQETFYQAFKNIKSFQGKCSIYTWLCTIVKNR